ncbi:NAD(P)H-dependent oxidoreductase [uncultured Erythrobacter sp.]|uniref:NAD(P)H-dependent oxidoreductase n=1 Tax=uncultured Erythrobacter sp. TaxID=263913 RepID=UPI002631939A|nr:NAD(P)H-dependent oxidoreductase [uncultured Erythrobacter sp.]
MRVLLLDGHPDEGRYSSSLLDHYKRSLPSTAQVEYVALRELAFDPNLKHGYKKRTEWEPDIQRLAAQFDDCDHLVVAFPMWWGSEPAMLKGLLDRLFLPGFMFSYRKDSSLWDGHMQGRSADVIATMDTPALFLWLVYGNALIKRWKGQVLGFVGFKPVRVLTCGPIKNGGAEKNNSKWKGKIEKMARSIRPKAPETKEPRLERFLNR